MSMYLKRMRRRLWKETKTEGKGTKKLGDISRGGRGGKAVIFNSSIGA